MKLRSDLHISRKLYHVAGVALIFILYALLDGRHVGIVPAPALTALAACLVIVSVDLLRIRHRDISNRLKVFQRVMRPQELYRISSMSFLLIGATIIICIFPAPIVYLSLLILGVGDPISGIIGVLYGKDKILPHKSLQGTVAGFLACTLCAFIFFWSQNIMVERLVLVSLLTGLSGALSELLPVGKLDDNFIIPIASSILLSGIFYIFGGFN